MEASAAPRLAVAEPLAVLAGGGSLPAIIASAAQRAGRPVLVLGIAGEADRSITAFPHRFISWGDVGALLGSLRRHRARDLVLVGRISARPDYHATPLDRGGRVAQAAILKIFGGGDNAVLAGAVSLLEARGFRIVGAHDIARDLVAPAGRLTRAQPDPRDLRDGELALAAARAIGRLDIGQAAVAIAGRVVAVEGAEGTDAMIERVAELRASGRLQPADRAGVLGKCAKPHQDLRIDMPTIGPGTVRAAAAAGLAGIVVEAGSVMLAEREETVRLANALGLFLCAEETVEAPA